MKQTLLCAWNKTRVNLVLFELNKAFDVTVILIIAVLQREQLYMNIEGVGVCAGRLSSLSFKFSLNILI